ncbi:MAG TPA: hypothetical protein PLE14_00160 [Anaerolineales bacterium]|nr:hypothetical protein [Anaerolineales bacterium]HNO30639.1 hypothetical protein [Anaerolineales bacterium]
MKKIIPGLMATLLFMLACGLNAPGNQPEPQINVETAVVQTLQALTDSAPLEPAVTQAGGQITPDGEIVISGGTSFLAPNGMTSGATATNTTEVEFPYVNPSNGDMPSHKKFILNNYPVQGTMFQPQVMVFKASEYAQYSEFTAKIIAYLQAMQYTDGQPLPEDLPSGPVYNARIHALNFQNGKGIRYLTQFDQAFMPANNQEMFYYFHGITSDGQYYVQAILPIQVPFLAADGNPDSPVPTDGVPLNLDDFNGYGNAITEKLNAADPFSFTPYLDHLDAMMESLLVNGL